MRPYRPLTLTGDGNLSPLGAPTHQDSVWARALHLLSFLAHHLSTMQVDAGMQLAVSLLVSGGPSWISAGPC